MAHETHDPDSGHLTGDSQARRQLGVVELRAYKTYRARQAASERLARRSRAWNWTLIALSTSTTVAAIGMLTDAEMYGKNGSTLMVCLSILVLVASLSTSSLDFSGRSRDMFLNYRKIQRLSVEMEEALSSDVMLVTAKLVAEFSQRYQSILDETENHTRWDHLQHFSRTLPEDDPYHSIDKGLFRARRMAEIGNRAAAAFPYLVLSIPAVLIFPLLRSLIG